MTEPTGITTAAQFKREKKKYDICRAHQITLIRVKENVESQREDVADAIYYIPKVRTYTKLEETINAILDAIDRKLKYVDKKKSFVFS